MLDVLRKYRVPLSSAACAAISIGLVMVNASSERRIDPLGVVFLEVMRPIQRVITLVSGGVAGAWHRYVALAGVEAENERLRGVVRLFEAQHARLREIELENERLGRLLGVRPRTAEEIAAARVIGRDSSGWLQTVTIDRGENHGVRVEMAVVTADGVVGRIAQTSPESARVLLVSAHNSGVDALVQRTRAHGILQGSIDGEASMKYIESDADVQVGDVVITSGLDGIYPAGIRIGIVTDVTGRDGLYDVASVVPSVEFSTLEEVLVVRSPDAARAAALDPGDFARPSVEGP